MTPDEFKNLLSTLHFNSYSNKDLENFRDMLNSKLTEVNLVIKCRKHYQSRFPSNKKKE